MRPFRFPRNVFSTEAGIDRMAELKAQLESLRIAEQGPGNLWPGAINPSAVFRAKALGGLRGASPRGLRRRGPFGIPLTLPSTRAVPMTGANLTDPYGRWKLPVVETEDGPLQLVPTRGNEPSDYIWTRKPDGSLRASPDYDYAGYDNPINLRRRALSQAGRSKAAIRQEEFTKAPLRVPMAVRKMEQAFKGKANFFNSPLWKGTPAQWAGLKIPKVEGLRGGGFGVMKKRFYERFELGLSSSLPINPAQFNPLMAGLPVSEALERLNLLESRADRLGIQRVRQLPGFSQVPMYTGTWQRSTGPAWLKQGLKTTRLVGANALPSATNEQLLRGRTKSFLYRANAAHYYQPAMYLTANLKNRDGRRLLETRPEWRASAEAAQKRLEQMGYWVMASHSKKGELTHFTVSVPGRGLLDLPPEIKKMVGSGILEFSSAGNRPRTDMGTMTTQARRVWETVLGSGHFDKETWFRPGSMEDVLKLSTVVGVPQEQSDRLIGELLESLKTGTGFEVRPRTLVMQRLMGRSKQETAAAFYAGELGAGRRRALGVRHFRNVQTNIQRALYTAAKNKNPEARAGLSSPRLEALTAQVEELFTALNKGENEIGPYIDEDIAQRLSGGLRELYGHARHLIRQSEGGWRKKMFVRPSTGEVYKKVTQGNVHKKSWRSMRRALERLTAGEQALIHGESQILNFASSRQQYGGLLEGEGDMGARSATGKGDVSFLDLRDSGAPTPHQLLENQQAEKRADSVVRRLLKNNPRMTQEQAESAVAQVLAEKANATAARRRTVERLSLGATRHSSDFSSIQYLSKILLEEGLGLEILHKGKSYTLAGAPEYQRSYHKKPQAFLLQDEVVDFSKAAFWRRINQRRSMEMVPGKNWALSIPPEGGEIPLFGRMPYQGEMIAWPAEGADPNFSYSIENWRARLAGRYQSPGELAAKARVTRAHMESRFSLGSGSVRAGVSAQVQAIQRNRISRQIYERLSNMPSGLSMGDGVSSQLSRLGRVKRSFLPAPLSLSEPPKIPRPFRPPDPTPEMLNPRSVPRPIERMLATINEGTKAAAAEAPSAPTASTLTRAMGDAAPASVPLPPSGPSPRLGGSSVAGSFGIKAGGFPFNRAGLWTLGAAVGGLALLGGAHYLYRRTRDNVVGVPQVQQQQSSVPPSIPIENRPLKTPNGVLPSQRTVRIASPNNLRVNDRISVRDPGGSVGAQALVAAINAGSPAPMRLTVTGDAKERRIDKAQRRRREEGRSMRYEE